jgi:broad specificity phosphatase PhoE
MQVTLPQTLWLVRHGQSAGNVARDAAEAGGLHVIDIATRDLDVPLSDLGERQAQSLGHWFGALDRRDQPQIVLCSPYTRAEQTARLLLENAGITGAVQLRMDERLREKEFGILDRLTALGIRHKYPELHEQRVHVGKFYFRPPGGESWCDVILRLRSVLEMATREYAGQRVLVVAHQVVVNCMRYLIEQMSEADILAIDRRGDIPNCSVTSYRADGTEQLSDENANVNANPRMVLDLVNFLAPLRDEGTPVTSAPDLPAAPKP